MVVIGCRTPLHHEYKSLQWWLMSLVLGASVRSTATGETTSLDTQQHPWQNRACILRSLIPQTRATNVMMETFSKEVPEKYAIHQAFEPLRESLFGKGISSMTLVVFCPVINTRRTLTSRAHALPYERNRCSFQVNPLNYVPGNTHCARQPVASTGHRHDAAATTAASCTSTACNLSTVAAANQCGGIYPTQTNCLWHLRQPSPLGISPPSHSLPHHTSQPLSAASIHHTTCLGEPLTPPPSGRPRTRLQSRVS